MDKVPLKINKNCSTIFRNHDENALIESNILPLFVRFFFVKVYQQHPLKEFIILPYIVNDYTESINIIYNDKCY